MGELEDKINSILNDPQELSKIASMAQSLMGGQLAPPEKEENDKPSLLQQLMGDRTEKGGREQTAFLMGMCPFLEHERGKKLEKAIKMSKMLQMALGFLKENGGEGLWP